MLSGRVIVGLACLVAAGGAEASSVAPVRLALSLHGLEPAAEISYHPYRWLTIRRSVAFVRPVPVDDARAAGQPRLPGSRLQALTGAIHPFDDAFRLSFGVREDGNGRLLRNADQSAAPGTGRYAPLVAVGFAGEAGNGVRVTGDIGLLGRGRIGARGNVLMTPIDLAQHRGEASDGYRPMLQLAAGYRF